MSCFRFTVPILNLSTDNSDLVLNGTLVMLRRCAQEGDNRIIEYFNLMDTIPNILFAWGSKKLWSSCLLWTHRAFIGYVNRHEALLQSLDLISNDCYNFLTNLRIKPTCRKAGFVPFHNGLLRTDESFCTISSWIWFL